VKKIIEKITTDQGVILTLEYDTDKNRYILTVEKDKDTAKFEGSIEEIQKAAKQYFIKSLKHLKNQMEIHELEELFKRS
jgi:glutamate formiminotransferase